MVTIHSLTHNIPIEMRLERRLLNIYACFDWLDKLCSRIWDWCVDAIVDELESFTSIGFSYGSLVWTIIVKASR